VFRQISASLTVIFTLVLAGAAAPSYGAVNNSVSNTDFSSVPVISTPSAPPLVLLGMSVDHELFKKAYTDYTDLDSENGLETSETSYDDSYEYYGYFNSDWCYSYGSGVFSPESGVDSGHTCTTSTSHWSGNFLNWATMTRMDVVRKVLYGGLRLESADDEDDTVLQRALLPNDGHAFVKVIPASVDASKYTPFPAGDLSICNVTNFDGLTDDRSNVMTLEDNPPLIKIAKGSFPQWSATEKYQCIFDEERGAGRVDTPSSATDGPAAGTQFNVRVKTCVDGKDIGASYCKDYEGDGDSAKPVGLLQRYGDDGALRFGLVTGSYKNRDKGGVLRKNIKLLAGNSGGSGDEVDQSNGLFVNQGSGDEGIINTLNRIRIAGWDYSDGKYYDCDAPSISVDIFKTTTASDRLCQDWGNPLSEIYLEALRYLKGEGSPTSAFDVNDSSIISGLNQVAWDDPMSSTEHCANCSIVLLSTGLNSFDTDHLASGSDLPTETVPISGRDVELNPSDIPAITSLLGTKEGITGGDYIVGNVLSDPANDCTSKTVSALGDVTGLCPEIPQLEGSYNVAGLAYYAKLVDLRTATGYPGTQNVDTYTVALAESLPSFEVSSGSGDTVSIVPTCQSNDGSGWGDCSLLDVTVESNTTKYGRFLVAWEDSHWGNDYDMDGIVRIEYCAANSADAAVVQAACDDGLSYVNPGTQPAWGANNLSSHIQIRVSVPQAEAGNDLQFGFVMNGSGSNGVYTNLSRPGGVTILELSGPGGSNPVVWDSVRTFNASGGTAGALLENPLYYAAKYGNFNDQDGDGTPGFDANNDGSPDAGDNREWDVEDINGNATPDGIPDSFFPVRNPANLEAGLGRVFSAVTANVASGTAAAVVANNTSGEGAVYQALYNPFFEDENNNRVEWVGMLQGIFIDSNGYLREDGDSDAVLDVDCSTDPIIEIFYDSALSETKLRRFSDSGCSVATSTVHQLGDLKPVWNARDQLSTILDPTSQRVYATAVDPTSSAGGRHILTSTAGTKGSQVDFNTQSVDDYPTLFHYFNVIDADAAKDVVNFIRGDESVSNSRSRTVDYDGDNVDDVWRLGDIVHSTPVVAGVPGDRYETLYGDKSYAAFKNAYFNRRQVVYVGANDGMIHAFNGGFWDSSAKGFKLQHDIYPVGVDGDGVDVAHPLGAELWAYVPYNLLPHLKWLKSTGYEHTYYVDGEPRLYDVNIFTPDTTHVEGWGTILVVGMRFGGGAITVDSDGSGTVGDGSDKTLRSAYVVLDVTDPESPPVLLGEITDPDMGFTVAVPALVKAREAVTGSGFTSASLDSWNLLMGSGPTNLASATSNKTAKLFGTNLGTLNGGASGDSSVTDFEPLIGTKDLAINSSFVGGLRSVDWDSEFSDDSVYFGISGGDATTATGTMMRQRLDTTTDQYAELVMGLSQSFISAPDVFKDSKKQQWVLAGTGRLFVTADQKTIEPQGFYGIKDPLSVPDSKVTPIPTPSAIIQSKLLNTTDVQVFTNNDVLKNGAAYSPGGTTISKFSELVDLVDSNSGWYNNFEALGAGSPSERNVSASVRVSNLVLYTSFDPGAQNSCDVGTSYLNVRHFNTGTAAPFAPIGSDSAIQSNSEDLSLERTILGAGLYSAPVLHRGSGGVTVITQGSTGAIGGDSVDLEDVLAGRQSWRQIYDF